MDCSKQSGGSIFHHPLQTSVPSSTMMVTCHVPGADQTVLKQFVMEEGACTRRRGRGMRRSNIKSKA